MHDNTVRFIDLFAGLGGTRIGFEQACIEQNIKPECAFTSEIKESAVFAYKNNFPNSEIFGDITTIDPKSIPEFDYLLAGFPCQPFSTAGKRNGFLDKRGGLFFTIEKILSVKKPKGLLLENVDGLASHNNGQTLKKIISILENLGYKTSWKILDSSNFGVPQKRKRIYIVGDKEKAPLLENFDFSFKNTGSYIDKKAQVRLTKFTKLLGEKFTNEELYGKSIKDKRGGNNNIHSWDLELKGKITQEQKKLLELILTKRRQKHWAELKGIDWMDGMPLTINEIRTFCDYNNLQKDLDYLTTKGYLKLEYPKKRIIENGVVKRIYDHTIPKGYNIVSGKLSFPLSKIIDPNDLCPTIVATEAGKIGVATEQGVRAITIKEGLSFSGFPDNYKISEENYLKAFDLIGNTVMPPVIKAITLKMLNNK